MKQTKANRRWWAIFNQEGPPDLDELFRRLSRSFGKRRRRPSMSAFRPPTPPNGNGDDSGRRPDNDPGFDLGSLPMSMIATIGSSIAFALVFLSGFFTVDESERAIIFRLGKPVGLREPGLRWRIPFVEDHRNVNLTGIRTIEIGYRGEQKSKIDREALMLTDNLNIVDIQFAVQYALKDPESYLFENRNPDLSVLQVAETAMREVVGKSDIDFVLYEGREDISAQTQDLMQGILDRYKTGIEIRQVAIQNVQPPDQVQDAFEDAIRARQDHDRKINEGQAYANDIVPRARGQAARTLEEAAGYKESLVARAEGEASRFFQLAEEYAQAPGVTRQRLYIETIESVLSRTSKVFIDQKEGSNNLLYLPLDQLGRGRGPTSRPPSPADSATGQPSGASGNVQFSQQSAELIDRLRRELSEARNALSNSR
jgi:membrane protease subunit HflK